MCHYHAFDLSLSCGGAAAAGLSHTFDALLTKGEGQAVNGKRALARLGESFWLLVDSKPWLSQTAYLPENWFYAESSRYHHVHNTLLQAGLDYGLLIALCMTFYVCRLSRPSTSQLAMLAMIPTESAISNFNLVAVVFIYIIFQREKNTYGS